ncbi:cadherin EGF LAG seven-pass G-type receptor 1-like [Ptychodera flava]|uniref:cadherin EGF LAG seven-pass G-type receptor 1-like n=1 Tax=Ptychodera flava TaxID=63121 RepID=UPI003969C014
MEPFIMIPCVIIVTAMNLTSVILLVLTKREFDRERRYYEFEEWHHFWADLRSIMLLLPVTALTWLVGTFSVNTNGLISGYLFAGFSFSLGSMIFLMLSATNVEVLVAIRVRFGDDDDEREALEEYKQTEHDRFNARRVSLEERSEINKAKQREQSKVTSRKNRIVDLFDEGRKVK